MNTNELNIHGLARLDERLGPRPIHGVIQRVDVAIEGLAIHDVDVIPIGVNVGDAQKLARVAWPCEGVPDALDAVFGVLAPDVIPDNGFERRGETRVIVRVLYEAGLSRDDDFRRSAVAGDDARKTSLRQR